MRSLRGAYLLLFLILSAICFPGLSKAGAWVNNAGEWKVIHNLTMFHYNQFVDSNGGITDRPDFMKYEYKPYIEYGINENWGAGFSPSFQHVEGEYVGAFDSGVDKNEALTSADIFIKRKIYESLEHGLVFSVIPMVELPGIYEEQTTPFFGKQESFWNLMMAVGKSTYAIEDNYGYINLEAGIRSRFSDSFTGDSGSAVKAELSIGLPVFQSHSVNLGLNYTKSVSGYTNSATSFLDKYGYDSMQASLADHFRWKGLELEYGYIYQFDARNTGIGNGVKISLWHKF